MRIGIIGAGNIGSALTRRFIAAGHEVKVANSRGPETLSNFAAETGATPVDVRGAVSDVDLVVVTIPEKAIPDLPEDLFWDLEPSFPIVDTGNYYWQRDGKIDEIEDGLTESQWVQRQLGHPVIKAFNNIYAGHLHDKGQPAGSPDRIALPVAGDDPQAKKAVVDLIDEIGFDAVDAGPLSESWRQQPGTPVYASDFNAQGVRDGLNAASPERQAEFRAQPAGVSGQ